MTPERTWIPAPQWAVLAGCVLALLGYLLPWFQLPRARWSFSGWEYATLSSGAGWTFWAWFAFVVAIAASLWSGRHPLAHSIARAGLVAALVLSLTVVIASFSRVEYSDLNAVADLPFGIGIPVMAAGFGIGLAAPGRSARRVRDAGSSPGGQ